MDEDWDLWRVCTGPGPSDLLGRTSRSGEIFFDRTAGLFNSRRATLDQPSGHVPKKLARRACVWSDSFPSLRGETCHGALHPESGRVA